MIISEDDDNALNVEDNVFIAVTLSYFSHKS